MAFPIKDLGSLIYLFFGVEAITYADGISNNGFPLDLDDHKNKKESPPIFFVRVWLATRDTCF